MVFYRSDYPFRSGELTIATDEKHKKFFGWQLIFLQMVVVAEYPAAVGDPQQKISSD